MSRYIDAEYNLHDLPNYYDFSDEGLLEITEALRSIPTADVRENVKGEWIYVGLDVAGKYMYQCSHCKAIIYEPEFLINYDKAQLLGNRFNYCPNCGAEMSQECNR